MTVSARSTRRKTGALAEWLVDEPGKPANAFKYYSNGHNTVVTTAEMRTHA